VTQVIIVGVYWPLLHRLFLEKLASQPEMEDAVFLYYHMIFIHSLPFLAVFLNVVCSRV
jgi:hypothetical protein